MANAGPPGTRKGAVDRLYQALSYRIVSGHYAPGAPLPSYRELGEEFGVSRTSVHKAIAALRDTGLAAVVPGLRAYVARELPQGPSDGDLMAELGDTIDLLAAQALRVGLPRERLLKLVEEHIGRNYSPQVPRLAFVECNRYDTDTLARQVRQVLEVPVAGLLLRELLRDPSLYRQRYDSVVTTYFHLTEVAEALGDAGRVLPVHHRPSPASLLEIARLPRGTVVGVLAVNERTLRIITGTVAPYLSGEVTGAVLTDAAAVSEVLRRADIIVDTMGSHAQVLRLGVQVPIITVQYHIDPESVLQLKQWFGSKELARGLSQ